MALPHTKSLTRVAVKALAAILLSAAALGQTASNEDDYFKIDRGRSMSASAARPASEPNAGPAAKHRITSDIEEALGIIRQTYAGEARTDSASLVRSSIEGMLRELDPHSTYFNAIEFRELLDEQQSEYYGIGTTIANYAAAGRSETFIISADPRSPAALSGLRFGDRIVAVDGEPAAGLTSVEVSDRIRGRNGTVVRLTIERGTTGRVETIRLRRGRISQPTVTDAFMLRPEVGYIALRGGFAFTTAAEFNRALRSLHKQGARSLVIDLRGNSGGILEQAVRVAEQFLPAGKVIVTQRGRTRFDSRVWRSANRDPETMPLIVLVDRETASASEIVAGALQDHDRALIVGEKTFGKGLVQTVSDLPAGAGLALTTSRYYTPSGRSIQRDYSSGDLYDYFRGRSARAGETSNLSVAETSGHRKVYSGDGITPDALIPGERLTAARRSLIDPLFFFTIELAAGRIKGLEKYAVRTARREIVRLEFPADTELVPAFGRFIAGREQWASLADSVLPEAAFISARIRSDLATAAVGTTAAARLQAGTDPQIAGGIRNLPAAAELARNSAENLRAARAK